MSLSGFWWLSSEDLGDGWWSSPSHSAWTCGRDFRHDSEFREHAPCFRQLWQDHPRVVPAYLCTCGSVTGAHSLYHLHTGVWTQVFFIKSLCEWSMVLCSFTREQLMIWWFQWFMVNAAPHKLQLCICYELGSLAFGKQHVPTIFPNF